MTDQMANPTKKPTVGLTLNKLDVIATWKYASENDDCKLCHQDLMTPVKITENTINGNVCIGTCNHGFHASCINLWIKNGNISCPICLTTWKSGNNVGSSVYVYKKPKTS